MILCVIIAQSADRYVDNHSAQQHQGNIVAKFCLVETWNSTWSRACFVSLQSNGTFEILSYTTVLVTNEHRFSLCLILLSVCFGDTCNQNVCVLLQNGTLQDSPIAMTNTKTIGPPLWALGQIGMSYWSGCLCTASFCHRLSLLHFTGMTIQLCQCAPHLANTNAKLAKHCACLFCLLWAVCNIEPPCKMS